MKIGKATASLFCIIIALCSLFGCSSKTAISTQVFTDTMEAENFTVTDVTSDIEQNDVATTVLIATCDNYQIEFWELTDTETGEEMFYRIKNSFNDKQSVRSMLSEVFSDNYNYYAFNADGNFHMVARIDNTIICCEAYKTYRKEIVDLIKNLGDK